MFYKEEKIVCITVLYSMFHRHSSTYFSFIYTISFLSNNNAGYLFTRYDADTQEYEGENTFLISTDHSESPPSFHINIQKGNIRFVIE